YTFSTGLRALLRHDPDVMLIGEIRDVEVARLATEASLTGHLVFSSLHTNSSIGAITRLRNLGIESYNIASSINAIFAQRLVRKVCPDCCGEKKVKVEFETKLKDSIERVLHFYPELGDKIQRVGENDIEITSLVPKEGGCPKCTHTGFVGQVAIAEAFSFTDLIREK
ncbi:MAG: Flp pilus assembly complex ATPase component, partial [Bacteroides sp.]|nr:Flp pilus assembly complex ATPase component [Bacteroides sp.]